MVWIELTVWVSHCFVFSDVQWISSYIAAYSVCITTHFITILMVNQVEIIHFNVQRVVEEILFAFHNNGDQPTSI